MTKKELYAAPATEVLELRLEGTVLLESNIQNNTTITQSAEIWDGNDNW